MRHTTQPTRPLQQSLVTGIRSLRRRWHCVVGIRAERQLARVSRLYLYRVTLPVHWWLALGQPAQFRPQVPWWQPFVYQFLVLVGRRPERPRRQRRA